MQQKIIHYFIIIFGWLAVLFPLWIRIKTLSFGLDSTLLPNIFPLFGITAFTLLWLHSLSGVFESWLRKYINFDIFIQLTSTIILVCIILHPLLLLMLFHFSISDLFLSYDNFYLWLGIIGLLLLLTYDIGKALKKYQFFVTHWNKILIISNIGFLLTFFHSLNLGTDLQSGGLRMIWIFYGITGMISIIYTYGIKRFIKS